MIVRWKYLTSLATDVVDKHFIHQSPMGITDRDPVCWNVPKSKQRTVEQIESIENASIAFQSIINKYSEIHSPLISII